MADLSPPALSQSAPVIERAPLPIIEVRGGEHRVFQVNAAFCALVGKKSTELIGLRFNEIVPGGGDCDEILNQVYETGEAIAHARPHESEPEHWWLYAMWPALDVDQTPTAVIIQLTKAPDFSLNTTAINEALLISGLRQHELVETAAKLNAQLQQEITERQQAEEELRASAERFRFLSESMPQKIFTAQPDGVVDYFNRQWIDFTGLSSDQIKNWDWRLFIHPDDAAETELQWRHSLRTGEAFQFQHRVRRYDGEYRWHLSRAHAMRDPAERVVLWVGSHTDIEDLRQAKEEAERASRAKDKFIAALSHELRTPLTPVLLLAEAGSREERFIPEVREQFAIIQRNVELEARLIDDLLDITRITHGKMHLRVQSCDPHALLAAALKIVQGEMVEKGLTVEMDLAPEQPQLAGDPARLQQVFWNLLKNAIKFSPQAGCLTVRSRNLDGGRVAFDIQDTGIGLTAEAITRIFLPFEQAEPFAEHRFGGLGLGLAISKTITELHGGIIRAASEGPGRGATFTVELPATWQSLGVAEVGPAATHRTPAQIGSLRILLVEDNRPTALIMTELLQADSHEVTTATGVAAAVAAAKTKTFDVVISDLGLPDGTGFDLMKTLSAIRPIPAIALSGYGMEDDLRRSREAGFQIHLIKPLDFTQLQQALLEVMA